MLPSLLSRSLLSLDSTNIAYVVICRLFRQSPQKRTIPVFGDVERLLRLYTSIVSVGVKDTQSEAKVKTKDLSLKAKAKNMINVIVVHRSNAMFIHISISNVLCTASRRAQFKVSILQRAL